MSYFQRDQGGYAFVNQGGKRFNMPKHWRYNKKKHGALIRNPFKSGGSLPASGGGSVASGAIGGLGSTPIQQMSVVGQQRPQSPVSPTVPRYENLAGVFEAAQQLRGHAQQLRGQVNPLRSEQSAMKAGNWNQLHTAYNAARAGANRDRYSMGGSLADRGLWGDSGARNIGSDEIQDSLRQQNIQSEKTFGKTAYNSIEANIARMKSDFAKSLMMILPPESVQRILEEG